jgi:hypothetical protein
LLAVVMIGTLPEPVRSQGNPVGNPFQGNNGNGPNPSRGNAGRNSGVTSTTSPNLAPTVRFAPPVRPAPPRSTP